MIKKLSRQWWPRIGGAQRLVIVVIVLGACGRGPRVQRCRFGAEKLIAASGSFIRAVTLAVGHDRLLAAWSDGAGTMVQSLLLNGTSARQATKVGPTAMSLDATTISSGFQLGMVIPGHRIWGGGEAKVLSLSKNGAPIEEAMSLGRAGAYSRGISVASNSLTLWHDGTPGDPALMMRSQSPRDADQKNLFHYKSLGAHIASAAVGY